jgi:uncharacterized protein with PQ loop repeat
MSEILGIIGAILLGACCLPQTIQTIRTRSATDIAWGFIAMWGIGELFMIAYLLTLPNIDYILLANYILNLTLLLPIVAIKMNGEKDA